MYAQAMGPSSAVDYMPIMHGDGSGYVPAYPNGAMMYEDSASFVAPPPAFVPADEYEADDDVDTEGAMYNKSVSPRPLGGFTGLRRATDRWWSALFLLNLTFLLSAFLGNIFTSSLGSLAHPKNFQGLACGWDEPVRHLPYLYFPIDPSTKSLQLQSQRSMCVARCPNTGDVDKRAFISIPESSLLQDKGKSTYVSVLHSLRSPFYVTKPDTGFLCTPTHPKLAEQMQRALTTVFSPTQVFAAGLQTSVPLFLGLSMASVFVSYVLLTAAEKVAGAITAVLVLSSSLIAFVFGFKLIFRSFSTLRSSHSILSFLAEDSRTLFLLGIVSLVVCGTIVVLVYSNFAHISDANRLLDAAQQCPARAAPTAGVYPILQFSMFFIALAGTLSFNFIASSSQTSKSQYVDASLDPNGGISISPLQHEIRRSSSATFYMFLVILGTIWALESILTLVKFIATSTTVTQYFYPNRFTHAKEPTLAMLTAYRYYIGALSLYAVLRVLTRPLRIPFMLAAGTRFFPRPQFVTDEERDAAVTRGAITQSCADRVQNAVFAEIIMRGVNLRHAVLLSSNRLRYTQHETIASTVGLASLITWAHGAALFMTLLTLTTSLLQAIQDKVASNFIGDPVATAMLVATLCTYICSVPWAVHEASTDALLYSVLVEMECKQGVANVAWLSPVAGPATNLCPIPLADVLNDIGSRTALLLSSVPVTANA